jgi:sulfofructose kinase
MTETPRHLLCIGIPVCDLTFRIPAVPPRGDKAHATQYIELSGGNALNAAVGIARLGGRAAFAGPMGAPGADAQILGDLAHEGINTAGVVRMPDGVTPVSAVMIDESGERTIVTYRDPRLLRIKLPDADMLLRDCGAILAESRCADFCTALCVEARRRGLPVVLDADSIMSLREGLLGASSHVIFSAEALRATAGTSDLTQALRRVAEASDAFLAVTTGAQGVTWLEGKEARHMPAFPVHTVDTLGAGDIFHGAFAMEIAAGVSIGAAMRFSAAAAALKCTRFGGAFAAPNRAEVEQLLAATP